MCMRASIRRGALVLICISAASCAARERTPPSGTVRLRFVPDSQPYSPLESSKGAVWTGLAPGLFTSQDRLGLQAHAAIGDKFPVKRKDGIQLYEVRLKDGNDDYLVLEILEENSSHDLTLHRNKKKTLKIGGVSYDFYYPTVEIAATENRSTTNKASVIITTSL